VWGLDVHKETVVACRRLMEDAAVSREARSFPTTTRGLLALADWLRGDYRVELHVGVFEHLRNALLVLPHLAHQLLARPG
jgi:hypothetical protein